VSTRENSGEKIGRKMEMEKYRNEVSSIMNNLQNKESKAILNLIHARANSDTPKVKLAAAFNS